MTRLARGLSAPLAQGRPRRGEVAYAYHDNKQRYFEHQCRVTADYVIPFIERSGLLPPNARVLEIGCGEAGVLKAFLERGAIAVGVDRNGSRLERGREFLAGAIEQGRLMLLHRDAHTLGEDEHFVGSFDVIVLKDVIEHVDDRPSLFALMARLLRPGGRVFLAFPPWQMPFGGHQQNCRSRVLSRLPYFHLLPTATYRTVLEAFREQPKRITSLLATKDTGISTYEFEALVERSGYRTLQRLHYLITPIYSYRIGLEPWKQASSISRRASWRDFVTTCAYYLVEPIGASAARRASPLSATVASR
jgi:SAM-dependent methyltransferase